MSGFSFLCRLNITLVVFRFYVLLIYCGTTNKTALIMFLGLFISSFHHFVKNDKKLNKNVQFNPMSTILGRKVDIVGHYLLNLYVVMEIVT